MMLCRDTAPDLDDDPHTCVREQGHREDHECSHGWTWADPNERRTR